MRTKFAALFLCLAALQSLSGTSSAPAQKAARSSQKARMNRRSHLRQKDIDIPYSALCWTTA